MKNPLDHARASMAKKNGGLVFLTGILLLVACAFIIGTLEFDFLAPPKDSEKQPTEQIIPSAVSEDRKEPIEPVESTPVAVKEEEPKETLMQKFLSTKRNRMLFTACAVVTVLIIAAVIITALTFSRRVEQTKVEGITMPPVEKVDQQVVDSKPDFSWLSSKKARLIAMALSGALTATAITLYWFVNDHPVVRKVIIGFTCFCFLFIISFPLFTGNFGTFGLCVLMAICTAIYLYPDICTTVGATHRAFRYLLRHPIPYFLLLKLFPPIAGCVALFLVGLLP